MWVGEDEDLWMSDDNPTRENQIAIELAELMSGISEEGFCAGWLHGLEYDLWSMVCGLQRQYGFIEVTAEDVARMKALSDQLGGWVVWDDDKGVTFIPMAKWLEMYEKHTR